MVRTPFVGDEKEMLHAFLQKQRDVVLWKIAGMTDEDLRTSPVGSGTTALGIVKHLAAVEYGWFCTAFGVETEPLPFSEDDPDADLRVEDDETTDEIVAFFKRARAAADAVIESTNLDETGVSWSGADVSMRWVLLHMIEETARHAGHLDIVRELVDGTTGYLPQMPAD